MKKLLSILVLTALFYSCEKPYSEASTGPPGLRIEIIDAITNENVFSNGTFTQSQVQVTTANSSSQGYSFISENNLNVIALSPAWTEGTFTTTIKLNNVVTIPIVTKIYKSTSRCFENYFIKSVTVTGYSYSQDQSTGIYKIKI